MRSAAQTQPRRLLPWQGRHMGRHKQGQPPARSEVYGRPRILANAGWIAAHRTAVRVRLRREQTTAVRSARGERRRNALAYNDDPVEGAEVCVMAVTLRDLFRERLQAMRAAM